MRKLLLLLIGMVGFQLSQAQISAFPILENFENESQCPTGCGPTCNLSQSWKNANQLGLTAANLNWTSDLAGTGSSNTGPSVDHTLGNTSGTYVYMETSCSGTGYPSKTAFLVSPYLDFRNVTVPIIEFWYHMYGQTMGTMHLDIDTTGSGTNWINDVIPSWTDNQDLWQLKAANLAAYAGHDSTLIRIRGISGNDFFSDMAVDDILIFEPQPYDFDMYAVSPSGAACGLNSDSVVSCFAFAGTDTVFPGDTLTLSYMVDMVTVSETYTIMDTMVAGDSVCYTFSVPASFPLVNQTYSISTWLSYPQDSAAGNDTVATTVTNIVSVTNYPYYEDFEANQGGWQIDNTGNGTWAYGTPNKSVIQGASSGVNCFVTGGLTTGDYNNNEDSWVTGPCYDFTNVCNPIIELDIWWNAENSWDGANLFGSTDGGQTWSLVGNFGDPNNWYTDNSINGAPGGSQEGWTGRNSSNNGSGTWVTAKHDLAAFANQPSVFLRIYFGSDGSVTDDGFAFDDIRIYDGVWLGDDVTLCSPATLTLEANPEPGDTVLWSTGATSSSITVDSTGSYSVTLIHNGCTSMDTIEVVVIDNQTTMDIGPDTSICGNSYMLDAGYFPGATYTWSTLDSAQSINVSASGTYGVVVATACTTFVDSVNITLLGTPTVSVGADTATCDMYMMSAVSGAGTYLWSTGDTTSMINVTSTGTYSVMFTDANGCTAMDSAMVMIWNSPSVSLGPDTSYCELDSICLTAGMDSTMSYTWSNGSTSMSTCFSSPGAYSVVVMDSNGCMGADTVAISEEPLPVAAFTYTQNAGAGFSFDFTDGSTGNPTSWSWDFGDQSGTSTQQNPSYAYLADGSYTVVLTVTNDCGTSTDSMSIVVTGTPNTLDAEVNVYPNPNNGQFNIELAVPGQMDLNIGLTNLYGQVVYAREIKGAAGNMLHEVNLNDIAAGVYFLRVSSEGKTLTRKIVIE